VTRDTLVPAGGASVSLAGTDYSTRADAAGRALLAPVLAGHFHLRVRTALMDSLGAPAVERDVEARDDEARVDSVALPGARELLLRACPRDSVQNGEGMLRGSVRDAGDRALKLAAVTVTWGAGASGRAGSQPGADERTIGALTDDAGLWRLCGVPRATALTVRAMSDAGADTKHTRLATDQPFGAADLVARPTNTGSSSGNRPRALVEVAVVDIAGVPLAGADIEVAMPGGTTRHVLTAASGRALLPDVPPGTLTMRARKIGFKPGQLVATVEAGRNTVPIILSDVSMPRLDTMRIIGGRRLSRRLDEFETRRLNHEATATITREDIEKRNPVNAWQMLTNVSAIRVIDVDGVVAAISNRSGVVSFMNGKPCYMPVMVDGALLATDISFFGPYSAGSFNLANLPPPADIHGIEVFSGPASIPVQYGGAGKDKWCGLIAVWTR
jgi:hypothetical protein